MNIESLLFKQIGKTAGKLHTARSRNDQVVTDFKLWIRNNSVSLDKHIQSLQKSLINVARKKYYYRNAWLYTPSGSTTYIFSTSLSCLC